MNFYVLIEKLPDKTESTISYPCKSDFSGIQQWCKVEGHVKIDNCLQEGFSINCISTLDVHIMVVKIW